MALQNYNDNPQETQTQDFTFDRYGWPIDPATGLAYLFHELVEDTSLPLPLYDNGAVKRARAKATGIEMKFKSGQRRENGKPKRVNYAERVLWINNEPATVTDDFIIIHRPDGTYRQNRRGGESWEA